MPRQDATAERDRVEVCECHHLETDARRGAREAVVGHDEVGPREYEEPLLGGRAGLVGEEALAVGDRRDVVDPPDPVLVVVDRCRLGRARARRHPRRTRPRPMLDEERAAKRAATSRTRVAHRRERLRAPACTRRRSRRPCARGRCARGAHRLPNQRSRPPLLTRGSNVRSANGGNPRRAGSSPRTSPSMTFTTSSRANCALRPAARASLRRWTRVGGFRRCRCAVADAGPEASEGAAIFGRRVTTCRRAPVNGWWPPRPRRGTPPARRALRARADRRRWCHRAT